MAFQVRASRRENGDYDLAYGKGGNKLEAVLMYDRANKVWHTTAAGQAKLKRDAMKQWGEWAADNYRGSAGGPPASKPDSPADEQSAVPPAPPSTGEDDLTDYQRAFFGKLAVHHGPLTEWQRSTARNMLKEIASAFIDPQPKPKSQPRPSGPPTYKAPAAQPTPPLDGEEPSVPDGEGADSSDGPDESEGGGVLSSAAE